MFTDGSPLSLFQTRAMVKMIALGSFALSLWLCGILPQTGFLRNHTREYGAYWVAASSPCSYSAFARTQWVRHSPGPTVRPSSTRAYSRSECTIEALRIQLQSRATIVSHGLSAYTQTHDSFRKLPLAINPGKFHTVS